MPKYRVISPLGHDGRNYAIGDVVELDPKKAERMPWAVEPAEKKAEPSAGEPNERLKERMRRPYRVLTSLEHEGKTHKKGAKVNLTDDEARHNEGKVEPITQEK